MSLAINVDLLIVSREIAKSIDSFCINMRWEDVGDKIVSKASLPAAKVEDVIVDINDKELTVTRELNIADGGTILERICNISRTFDLPDGVKRSNFKSTAMEDGILTVTFTKDAAVTNTSSHSRGFCNVSRNFDLPDGFDMKTEKNGSVLKNLELLDGGAPAIEFRKVIRFLKARMFIEFPGGDNKVMVVRVVDLPAGIEKKDVEIAVENRNLVMELKTMLEDYGKIKKRAELPDGVTVRKISTLMEDQLLTVTVALEKAEPAEKPKSMISKIKGALARAWPGCLAIGAN